MQHDPIATSGHTVPQDEPIKKALLKVRITEEAATRLRVAAAISKPREEPGEIVSRLIEKHLPSLNHVPDGFANSTGSSTD